MNIIANRKGITPVIAIVLLLMVTVGAVGVVYTQFQSLVGNPSEEINKQQRNQNTKITILRGETNVSNINTGGDHNLANYGTLHLRVQNIAEDISRNTTDFLMTSPSAHIIGKYGDPCTQPGNSTIIDPGETIYCNTGVLFPQSTDVVEIKLQLQGSTKEWTFSCRHSPTGNTICSQ